MGKNGALLRATKANKIVYTFTKEQLAEHDHNVRLTYKKRCEQELKDAEARYKKAVAESRE